ncbi:MAG: tyrosine-type recombinase/integrase [Candidatus Dormibacteria bacterium]
MSWNARIERGEKRAKPRLSSAVNGMVTFEAAVDTWIDEHVSAKTGRAYSQTTRKVIRANLLGGRLSGWRQARAVVVVQDWTADLAAEYITWYQHEMGADADTAKKVRSQLRQFSEFCRDKYQHEAAVGAALTGLRINSAADADKKKEDALTKGEAERLMNAAAGTRDKVIVAMLLYTGMRPSELIILEERHVNFNSSPPVVQVRGSIWDPERTKTEAGFRTIPLTIGQKVLPKLLRDHLSDPSRPAGALRLFLSERPSKKGGHSPLTIHGLDLVLERLGERTAIHANAYRFRHTFCTWAADAGVSELHLQSLLGHASRDMVAYYYRGKASQELLEAVSRVRF